MFNFIKKIGRFIIRLSRWLPIIWNQEDWDYAYIFPLIELKLRELKRAQEKDTWHLDSKKRAKQISICLEYLKRYIHWEDYIEFPKNDVSFENTSEGLIKMITGVKTKIACKKANSYEEFYHDMFWKKFLKWYRGWWT